MGLKKKWHWNTIDWDDEISKNGICIDPRDLKAMNSTEMVEILNLMGIRAHSGMSRNILSMILERGEVQQVVHPLDPARRRLMNFLEKNLHKIRDQLLIQCHRNCFRHHDAEVLVCYMANKARLEGE
jgi:hypothetical protein